MHLCSLTGSTQSICGACNAFRGSSHQLETPPSSLHQWETPPSSSHHSQLKAPTLMVPPRSYSEDLQFQNFSVAVDDKMQQTLWHCHWKPQPKGILSVTTVGRINLWQSQLNQGKSHCGGAIGSCPQPKGVLSVFGRRNL